MTEQALPLITFYKGWETYQHYLVETIASQYPVKTIARWYRFPDHN